MKKRSLHVGLLPSAIASALLLMLVAAGATAAASPVSLEVRPQINAGGTIKLDIRQEVSSIAGPVSENFQDLILNKREIETTITVDDGEIVGIGGLLDDNDRRTLDRIPVLGGTVPI